MILPITPAQAAADSAGSAQSQSSSSRWQKLRAQYFQDRAIADGAKVVGLKAPRRAQDPAVVPIAIIDRLANDADRRIAKLWLVIDNNPEPMSARFTFGASAVNASIATRVRVNAYTHMRVIAETQAHKLYMTTRYVKASGGCSAPVSGDIDKALAHMGEMRLRHLRSRDGGTPSTSQVKLMIRHPNITGLQMNQLTRLVRPAHFVDRITVRDNGKPVFDSHMTFSLSQNPSLRFYVPSDKGKLSVRVHDNKGNRFTHSWPISASARPAGNGKAHS